MQSKTLAAAVCATLLSANFVSLAAQQQALPAVRARPRQADGTASLAEAARNDQDAAFIELYEEMQGRGENVDAYTPLYDLAKWSLANPGAAYGTELYEKLARADAEFAQAVAPFASVDSAGNVVWPVRETREFLLRRVVADAPPAETPLAPVKALKPGAAAAPVQPAPAADVVTPAAAPVVPVGVADPLPPAPPPAAPFRISGLLLLFLIPLAALGLFVVVRKLAARARRTEEPELDELRPPAAEPVRKRSGGVDVVRAIESHGSDDSPPHSPSSPDRSRRDEDARGLAR